MTEKQHLDTTNPTTGDMEFMDDDCVHPVRETEPKPTGEWTNMDVEQLWEKGGSIAVKDAHNAAVADEQENADKVKQWALKMDAENDHLQKQLAAEEKRYAAATWDMADLRRQLAAERDKHEFYVKEREQALAVTSGALKENQQLREQVGRLQRELEATSTKYAALTGSSDEVIEIDEHGKVHAPKSEVQQLREKVQKEGK